MSPADSNTTDLFSNCDDLTAIEADCWKLLAVAPHDRGCGWRLPVLATNGEKVPRQRTVVLRHVELESREIFIHTDVRSPKVDFIQANPWVSWLFYDAARHVQVQLVGQATVLTDVSDTQWLWDREPESSLRGYLAPYVPGRVCEQRESNLPAECESKTPDRTELTAARDNFAVICHTTKAMEFLLLRPNGNIRGIYSYSDAILTSADWLAP